MDVPPHPHTGLQTVSWLFRGEIEHRDSSGVHALVRPGELNLMTGGYGVAHSEVTTRSTTTVHVLNGHGGNRDALREAADLCRSEGRHLKIVHLGTAGMDAHAGRAETSMMLHLAPNRVRVDLAEPGLTDPVAALLPTLVRRGVRAVSPNGVLGDPSGASAAEGARLVEGLVTAAVAAYDHCLAAVSGDERSG
jgi:mycofactocin precursor peptide peptidase